MGTLTYNTNKYNLTYIYRHTGGVWSANLATSTTLNFFTTTSVANDAIYFGVPRFTNFSNLYLNIGTPVTAVGLNLVWEYYAGGIGWRTCHNLTDGSSGFTTTGAVVVKFPIQAMHRPDVTVNGIASTMWVRCRITSVTSISNGGAQQTATIQTADGRLNVTGYSDASPCTFLECYNWLAANAPETSPEKIATDVFKFNNVVFNIATTSTLRSTDEKIFMGNGAMYGGTSIYGLWSGTKVGTNGWSNPSYYYFCYGSSTLVLTMDNLTRVFGGEWNWFNNIVDGVACTPVSVYLGVSAGEWRGVYLKNSGYFATATCDRCVVDGGLITAGAVTSYPTNLQIANPATNIWQMYGIGNTITGVTYGLPSVSIMNIGAAYNTTFAQQYNFINPSPSFPSVNDTVKPVTRAVNTPTNGTACYFYDASAGTYTDYSAAAISDTINDVPIWGDVGDILYIRTVLVNTNYQTALNFTITPQTNNYGYAFEHYDSTVPGWKAGIEGTSLFDTTDNLSKSGIVYFGMDRNFSSVTVNGNAGYWVRVRITSVGTGSPVISKVQSRLQAGIGDWKVNELYSYDLKTIDSSETDVASTLVYIKDVNNVVKGTFTTDSSGNITQQNLNKRYYYFDKNQSEALFNINEMDVNPYLVRVRKYGYFFQDSSKTVSGKSSDVTVLQTNVGVVASEATALAYTGIAINTGTEKITVSSNHTMTEVYEYCQAWLAQSANIAVAEFLTTNNGTSFVSSYNIEVNNCTLSGSGTISMPAKSFSFVGTGTTTLIYTDSSGTNTILNITGGTAHNIRVTDNTSTEKDIEIDFTGDYLLNIPSGATGTWNYKISKYGYLPSITSFSPAGGYINSTFTLTPDTGITQVNPVTVAAYTTLENVDKFYDYAAYYETTLAGLQYIRPTTKSGIAVDLGSKDLAIDATLSSVYSYTGSNVSIKATVFASGSTFSEISTTGTLSVANGASVSIMYNDSTGRNVYYSVSNIVTNSRVQLYNVTDDTEIYNAVVTGTSLIVPTTWTSDKSIRIRATYCIGTTSYLPFQAIQPLTENGMTVSLSQVSDDIYNGLVIDGSNVSECSANFPNIYIDITDPDGTTTIQRVYAWFKATEYTEDGIKFFFDGLEADDDVNFRINTAYADLRLFNVNSSPVILTGARIYRSDNTTVIAATSNSIQIDPSKAYIAIGSTGASAQEVWEYTTRTISTTIPTAAQNASAVRTELTTELGRIDVAISTRNSVAPDNASITSIKAKTDNLPSDPADNSEILAALDLVPTASENAAQVRTELATELSAIGSIKTKTDNLPTNTSTELSDIKKNTNLIPATV